MYPLIKQLALLPMNLILVIVAGLLLRHRWRGLGNAMVIGGVVTLYAVATPVVGGVLLRAIERTPPLAADVPAGSAGAIVILSAGLRTAAPEYGGETVDGLTLERLRYGAHLHRRTGLPIAVTGGTTRLSPTPLAHLMKRVLEEDFRVPVAWVEDRSTNTFENARLTADLLRRAGIGRVYLVTHAFHMDRARPVFTAAGLGVIPAPTGFTGSGPLEVGLFLPSVSGLRASYLALHEVLGRLWYGLTGYDRPAPAAPPPTRGAPTGTGSLHRP